MGDVVNFMTYTELQQTINELDNIASGMSPQETVNALHGTKIKLRPIMPVTEGLYTANINVKAPNNVIEFPSADTPAETLGKYLESGNKTANITFKEGATTSSLSIAGLLSVNIPTIFAAVAPLLGFAAGVGLYELNPTFWTRLSQKLLPFCYDETELIPVPVDKNGRTYISNPVIKAIRDLLLDLQPEWSSEVLPFTVQSSSTFTYTYRYQEAEYTSSSQPTPYQKVAVLSTSNSIIQYLRASSEPVSGANQFIHDGKTAYYGTVTAGVGPVHGVQLLSTTPSVINTSTSVYSLGAIAWTILYGDSTNLLEGVEKWLGDLYDPSIAEPDRFLIDIDEEGNGIFEERFPVRIPIGDPWVTDDPDEHPNPTISPDPDKAIPPWIKPNPDPSTYPVEVPVSEPAPLPDPVPANPTDNVPLPYVPPDKTDPIKLPDDPTPPPPPDDGGDSPIYVPPISINPARGLLHAYNPTPQQIESFGAWLWNSFTGDITEIAKIFNDPMDAIIGLHELYATPSVSGSSTIKAGYLDSNITASLVNNRYTTIDCGTLSVKEYYNNYLDYTPYTQCFIYLPFIGIVPVSADDIIGNSVNITYHVDSYTGSCIAVIKVSKEGYSASVYQFEGNCAVEIPVTGGYQSALMASLLGTAGTLLTGNLAVGLASSNLGRAGLGKNSVAHSGNFSSTYGAMGVKKPYIIVKRPKQKIIANYSLSYGYPAHKMVYVGNCTGYLRAREVRVLSTRATNVEKELIVKALKDGIYVK